MLSIDFAKASSHGWAIAPAISGLDYFQRRFDNCCMAQVVLEHVSKIFRGPENKGIHALEDAGFVVEDKELLVLVGPSGCGKTTTLRLIAGLEEVTSGKISIDGRVVNDVPPKDRDVAMVFQNHALYPHMSVFENLAFGLKVRKLSGGEIERRVKDALEMLDLQECSSRRPEELSGGQRQRVAVGRAVVLRPKVFLFDEPLSNLDLQMRSQLRAELAKLHARLGATMIYVTHDQVEAMTLGDRIAVLRDGNIQQVAEPMALYREPVNMFVAGFIGTPQMNFFRGRLTVGGDGLVFEQAAPNATSGSPLRLRVHASSVARFKGHADKPIVLGVRPEDIRISAPESKSMPDCTIDAVVERVEQLGSETHLHFSGNGQSFIARTMLFAKPRVGEVLALSVDMGNAKIFDAETERAIC